MRLAARSSPRSDWPCTGHPRSGWSGAADAPADGGHRSGTAGAGAPAFPPERVGALESCVACADGRWGARATQVPGAALHGPASHRTVPGRSLGRAPGPCHRWGGGIRPCAPRGRSAQLQPRWTRSAAAWSATLNGWREDRRLTSPDLGALGEQISGLKEEVQTEREKAEECARIAEGLRSEPPCRPKEEKAVAGKIGRLRGPGYGGDPSVGISTRRLKAGTLGGHSRKARHAGSLPARPSGSAKALCPPAPERRSG